MHDVIPLPVLDMSEVRVQERDIRNSAENILTVAEYLEIRPRMSLPQQIQAVGE